MVMELKGNLIWIHLYKLCKLAGIVTFDNHHFQKNQVLSFTTRIINFNDSISGDIESESIYLNIKTNESVRTINNNEGSLCIRKAGSLLLQIYTIHVFIKLKKIFIMK
jgi:hypothetical protein